MVTRRQFLGAAVAAGVLAPAPAVRAQVQKIRIGNAAGIIDAQLAFNTVGEHPKTQYYKQEGVEIDIVNMSSSSQSLQALATGNVELTNLAPPIYLGAVARTPDLNVISCYTWMHQVHWAVAVKPESPAKELRDLKGKRIGIRNTGDTGYFGARAMYKELGLEPDRDFDWISVGGAAPAGQAIERDQVDALAIWDAEFARIENTGVKLRYLPNTPGMRELFGGSYGTNRAQLKANRDKLVRFLRALAKSTIFAATNPEAAIRMHWELYPESKPKGKSDAVALREALHVIKTRTWKWIPAEWQEDKRMGGSTLPQWQAQVRFVGLADKIKDAQTLFTNELLDDVNRFDRKAVEDQARSMRA